ncbi:MAG: molybdopterin-dependent oxidoreductase [Methanosarcinales archaeon]
MAFNSIWRSPKSNYIYLERIFKTAKAMKWSKLDNKWEGVKFKAIANLVKPKPTAKFATIESEELLEDDVLFAYKHDDDPLSIEHGGPLRLVVPKKYAYKSAKWVVRLLGK